MNDNTLRKIAYNCKKATFLIEKKQVGSITVREKLELKIHLAGCAVCRTFEQQSIVINKMVHDLFHEPKLNELKLDDDFKRKLQGSIDEKLDKN
ncbi:hypothetical protein [Mucilaginibacter polytrichastri]|uniref:Zinc-finger domain-containing protein n=1 Tax=Mucilaginibacter polytrichastri TaxID=1302689 RepID=A0A1Q6A238_9SPHI|nr:hypothetical protein [Mucilaginibacter polytrichastri]OKS88085.1 hypothetical protein RG47T_3549 [Mucilaginibacter polytrichastri]SFT09879.1 hypothetical protein SAMN04487890_110156 [Mucilaginibacter polytrichastri]